MWAPQTKWYYFVDVHTHKLTLENLGGVLFPALFIGNAIHSGKMHTSLTIHTGIKFIPRR